VNLQLTRDYRKEQVEQLGFLGEREGVGVMVQNVVRFGGDL